MATVKRKSAVPYYACGGVWVLYAALFPLYRVSHFALGCAGQRESAGILLRRRDDG